MSVKDAMPAKHRRERTIDIRGHMVYMIRDEDIVLYVGKGSVYDRLSSHMQEKKPSRIGKAILDNMPYSLGWVITLYTIEECKREFAHVLHPSVLPQLDKSSWKGKTWEYGEGAAIELAERAAIHYFKPCLNVRGVLTK